MSDYPDPTPEMLDDPLFEAIWQAIKRWDISRHNDGVYSGPTGNDARHIYDAVRAERDRLREALIVARETLIAWMIPELKPDDALKHSTIVIIDATLAKEAGQ
jgi:hypothetical protein